MRKILIVSSVISFIEWFNKENVDYLHRDLNCEVHIACDSDYMADTDEARTKAYISRIQDEGVILHNVCFDRSPFGKRNFQAYRQIQRIIDENDFDLIHCHTPAASVLTRLAAHKARKKGTIVAYTCHGFHFHNAAPKKNWLLYYPVEKILSAFCDYLITINREDYNRALTFHAKHVRYIPGVGVDISQIMSTVVNKYEYKQSLGIPGEAVMILSLGELIERKNHEVIIRALARIDRNDIYYAICGKGPLRDELESLAYEVGLGDRVLFLGFRTDVPELCNTADISAFPSKIEGLGLAGIEAMAAGVPLISSNVHGILDYVINGKTGYACAPDDIEGFATAINLLANDKHLREEMRESCLEAVEPFEIGNALRKMQDIYREMLSI